MPSIRRSPTSFRARSMPWRGEDAIRVVLITGAGRGFCSGLDLSAPPRFPDATRAERLDPFAWVGRWVLSVVRCEKPVIAAVNGPAAGAGFGLALAADIRLVAASARMTAGYVRRGLSPDAGVSFLLPRIVGLSRATEILFTGRDIDAAEAERIGLAAMVIADDGFADHAYEYAERLAGGPAERARAHQAPAHDESRDVARGAARARARLHQDVFRVERRRRGAGLFRREATAAVRRALTRRSAISSIVRPLVTDVVTSATTSSRPSRIRRDA